ncbi:MULTISPECIES: hypothetical protein [unclassified Cellulomonas]|uniref:hypothetical protein n=1 Tax=unclassified Cellulomonas TaxID=2620175 RepID=UPI0019BDA26B|nr:MULTISPECIES: hypothetical protein [unclassified Cellulomonas]MBD3778727.1 hypothetical protein [Micrococcales bacterium]QZN84326.1 hypothetical protein K5O09_10590 [Cellulomonas sp. C5510]WHP17698.1 hypothetical protein P9841_00510 [Cellulomonas sp. ES6]
MADEDEARVVITNADIAAAKRDWQLARSRGDLPVRIDAAYDLYRRLVSAQAQQIADTFRETGRLRADQG